MNEAQLKQDMQKSIDYLAKEFAGLQAGRATKGLVEDVVVETSYAAMPIGQLANISLPDAQTIKIEPWDKGVVKSIEDAIYKSDRGLTPRNDGSYLMITIPPLTKERREQIVKQVKNSGEEIKARLRKTRQEARDLVKKAFDEKEISEDQKKADESTIDAVIKEFNGKIDALVKAKSDDVMKV